jgi:uncharacterized glyoxalase superfamily protein PhnB
MVEWLCDAFGFRKQLIVKGENSEVKHAELAFGESVIMVVPARDTPFEKVVVHPDQIGGVETQACYLVVADVEGHYAKASVKGAKIIFDIRVENHGGRAYACRDPEGHMWIFGTYDPRGSLARRPSDGSNRRRPSRLAALVPLLLSTLVFASVAAAVWSFSEMRRTALILDRVTSATPRPGGIEGVVQEWTQEDGKNVTAKLLEVETAKTSAEQSARALAARLARERAARESAVESGKETQERLSQELRAKEALSRAAQRAIDQLGQERIAREIAEKAARDATDQLEHLRVAKSVADRTAKEAIEQCEQGRTSQSLSEHPEQDAMYQIIRERNARAVAELAANELRNQLVSFGPEPQERISDLRNRIEVERRANGVAERAVKDAQQKLAQEKHSRDAAERALKQAEQKLAALPSCWTCPTDAPCER